MRTAQKRRPRRPTKLSNLDWYVQQEKRIAEATVRAALLRRERTDGYLYVIEFSTGVVKVGRTVNRDQRLAAHRRIAGIHGVDITRSWVSEHHDRCADSESRLIEFGKNWGVRLTETRSRKGEYFRGLRFEHACWFARRLVDDQRRRAYLDRLTEAAHGDLSMTWEAAHALLPDDEPEVLP